MRAFIFLVLAIFVALHLGAVLIALLVGGILFVIVVGLLLGLAGLILGCDRLFSGRRPAPAPARPCAGPPGSAPGPARPPAPSPRPANTRAPARPLDARGLGGLPRFR
jgi:hypothetical protein